MGKKQNKNLKIDRVIYLTTNLLDNTIYVGQDMYNDPDYFGSGKHYRNAEKKYGKHNFKKQIIDYAKTQDELNEKEIYWIDYYRKTGIRMYNITKGGEGMGDIFTNNPRKEEIREKLRITSSRKYECQYCKKFYNIRTLVFFHNENCKQNPNRTQESINKIASWSKKISDLLKNIPKTEEHNKKVSEALKNQEIFECKYCHRFFTAANLEVHHNENCKMNPNRSLESIKKQEETNKKISISHTGLKGKKEDNLKISKVLIEKYASGELVVWNKGLKFPFKKRGKYKKQEKAICIYCFEECSTGTITRYHNEHCYKNPNIDIEAEKLRRERKNKKSISK